MPYLADTNNVKYIIKCMFITVCAALITNPITCMKLLASSIPGRESAKSESNSLARPERPAN
jgi:hypothetical protein